MDDAISKVDNKEINSSNVTRSTEENKIKYYECNDKNCTFEILNYNNEDALDQEYRLDTESPKIEDKVYSDAEIIVTSVLDCGEHEYLQCVKINLYKINGLSPILIKSEITDEVGKVIFSEVEEGCYRIIEIVDKRYFEKPKYINWNEIIIDSVNKNQKVVIVNRIKRLASKNKHKQWI